MSLMIELMRASKPLPGYIQSCTIIDNLLLYRRDPETIAALLDAIANSMRMEAPRCESSAVADALEEQREYVVDAAKAIAEAIAEGMGEPCDCGGNCDACQAAVSDEAHDRKIDGELMRTPT